MKDVFRDVPGHTHEQKSAKAIASGFYRDAFNRRGQSEISRSLYQERLTDLLAIFRVA